MQRYRVVVNHGEYASTYNVVDTAQPESEQPCIVIGWSSRTEAHAAYLAANFCTRHNAKQGGLAMTGLEKAAIALGDRAMRNTVEMIDWFQLLLDAAKTTGANKRLSVQDLRAMAEAVRCAVLEKERIAEESLSRVMVVL
jgi:hypothetical protein